MIVALAIFFEAFAILFMGIFARTDATASLATQGNLLNNCLMLILAFTLIFAPLKQLSLYTIASLLLVVVITTQTYFLFGTFWNNCFQGFNSTFTIDIVLIIRALHASLAVVLTALDFIGLFCYWQVYLILAPIMTIGLSLSWAILVRGLKIFDGGSGMLVFLYSGICSLIIWAYLIKGKVELEKLAPTKQSYFNQTIAMIGVVLAFINWPKFNAAGSLVSFFNVDTTSITTDYLMSSAIVNTLLGLSAAILMAFFMAEKDSPNKMKFSTFVDCFTNAGISISSFQDIALNPSACLAIAFLSSFLTLIFDKKYLSVKKEGQESDFKQFMKKYARIIYRIIFSFLGVIICSIIVASRSGQSPNLITDTYSKIAGFQILGFLIVLAFAAIFGVLSAILIKVFLSSKAPQLAQQDQKKINQKVADDISRASKKQKLQLQDRNYFMDMDQQLYPLHLDMLGFFKGEYHGNFNSQIKNTADLQQSLVKNQIDPHHITQIQRNIKEPQIASSPSKMVISKTFTRDNQKLQKQVEDVSAMKFQKFDGPVDNQASGKNADNKLEEDPPLYDNSDELPNTLGETRVNQGTLHEHKSYIRRNEELPPVKQEPLAKEESYKMTRGVDRRNRQEESEILQEHHVKGKSIRQEEDSEGMVRLDNKFLISRAQNNTLNNSRANQYDRKDSQQSRVQIRMTKSRVDP